MGVIARILKFFLVNIIIGYCGFIASGENNYTALRIQAIKNSSKYKVSLPDQDLKLLISSENHDQIIILKEKLDIPFISITEYIKDYTKSAQGKAFIPKGALLLKIGNRIFGLWENEKGVMCSCDASSCADDESWPDKLFNNLNKRKPEDIKSINSILKLILFIDKKGRLSLENFKTQ